MAPHAKYFAVYDKPFWREQGLSGEARSIRGPLGEIHDASIPGGSAALFGFLILPASMRAEFTDDQLFALCRSQLARMFGPQAAAPMAEFLKDWAKDKFTATALDLESNGGHSPQPQLAPQSGPWSECLLGIGSEWAQQFPGYIAGAIEAADKGIQIVARHVKARGETCQ